MNKDGKIILLDTDSEHRDFLCGYLEATGHKNDMVCFSDAEEAAAYLRDHLRDVFMFLQSTNSAGVQIPNTRNMIYMHEKFKTDILPYMFLVLTVNNTLVEADYKFVHSYYKFTEPQIVSQTLGEVIDFWKDHMFPPKVNRLQL